MTLRSDDALTHDDNIHEMDELFTVLATRNHDWMGLHKYFASQTAKLENNGRYRPMGSSQITKLLAHFKKAGSITVREALIEYSIQSLTKRIQEMRDMGYNIQSIQRRHPVTKQRYVRYHLISEKVV